MKRIAILFAVLAVFLWVGGVSLSYADTFTFGDNNHFWGDAGNWGSAAWTSSDSGPDSIYTPDDAHDVIGDPDITGGGGTIDSAGHLTEIYFNYSSWGSGLAPGDLFIDIGADMTWQYVVTPEAKIYSVPNISALKPSSWNPQTDAYLDSNEVFGASVNYSGWDWRNDHPVKADFDNINESFQASATFSGFNSNIATAAAFSGLNIDLLGKDFNISWSPTCANDVVYEKVLNPVPEPATMLLFGTGLIGLAGLGRKKFLKKG